MQVSYGGVVFEIVRTNQYAREPVWSEDRTELLFMRTTYDLTMCWNGKATSYAGNGNGFASADGARPGQTDVALRYHLLKPRQQFQLTTDEGDPLLTVPAVGSARDPDHGPRPVSCTVEHVCTKTWRVRWVVSVATIECGGTGSYSDSFNLAPIVSNRYTQSQETGLDRLTRITTRGVTRFRADALDNQNTSADAFRSRCIPGLPLGFQRQAIQVAVSPDGLTLLWSTTDQEMMTSLGATDDPGRGTVEGFEASFSLGTTGPDSNNVPTGFLMGRFDGYAWGAKDASRSAMFSWLARLAIERLALPVGQVDPSTQPSIMRVSTNETIHKPTVELHIDVKFPPARAGKQGFGPLRMDLIGVDTLATFANNGQNPQMPGDGNTRGTANVLAFAAAIKEACGPVPDLPFQSYGSQGYVSDNYTASTVDVQVSSRDFSTQDTSTNISTDAASSGVYTEMSVMSTYRTSQGTMQAPIAGKPQEPYSYTPGGPGSGPSTSSTDAPTSEVLTLSLPMTELTVTFEAERSSSPPIIPNAKTTLPGLTLLHETIAPMAVGLDGDGVTPVYRIGGEFRYAVLAARKPGTSLTFGVHPFTDFQYADSMASIGPESMVNGIVDPPFEVDVLGA